VAGTPDRLATGFGDTDRRGALPQQESPVWARKKSITVRDRSYVGCHLYARPVIATSAPLSVLADSVGDGPVLAALISALVALVVALLTQVLVSHRDSVARRYDRRRGALLLGQDAALALRGRLIDLGRVTRRDAGQPSAELAEAERRFDDARALLDVSLTRIDDPEVVRAATLWRDHAQQRHISTLDVTETEETTSWMQFNVLIGKALTSRQGLSG